MSPSLDRIRQRRAVLMARAEAQRNEVARVVRPWRVPLSVADRALAVLHRLRAHPLAVTAAMVLLVWIGRNRKSPWAGRLLTLWQLYSAVQSQRHRGR
jgi:hypothetical protein